MAQNTNSPFLWGQGGTMVTPEQVKRQREIAASLMQSDFSPVGHWTQGLARLADAAVGAYGEYKTNEQEQAGRDGFQSQWDSVFGGSPAAPVASIDPVAQALVGAPQVASDATLGSDWLSYSNQGATRNLPLSEQLTSALSFLPELGVSMEVFSGGQPGEGEGPRVGSDRHDHGNAADVFFSQNGKRLDWANPEQQPIFEEIVRRGKEAGITGFGAGDGYMQPGSMHLGFGPEAVWGAGGSGANAPDWLQNAFGGASGGGAPQVAQALMGNQPSMQQLMTLASDPWASDAQKSIINSLLGQQMQQQAQANDPMRKLQLEQLQMQNDAMRNPGPLAPDWQTIDNGGDVFRWDANDPNSTPSLFFDGPDVAQPGMFDGTGMDAQAWNILNTADPASKEYATAYSIIAQPKPQMVQTENGMMLVPVAPQLPAWLVPPGSAAAPAASPASPTAPAAQAPLMPQGQSQANPAIFGNTFSAPAGAPAAAPTAQPAAPQPSMAGAGQLIPGTQKPSTEQQQRNEMLGTVLTSDLPTINANFDALADPQGQLLGMIPGGLGNPWQSPEYQQAANAVSSSVANILYSVSGASANPGETANQIRNLTPAWGDKPATIADKKRRLNTFVNAVASASGNPELIEQARAESVRGMEEPASAVDPSAPVDIDSLLQKYGTP